MIQNHAYLIRRNGIFYFSRRVPADVRSRFNKDRVIVSLHTRSLPKAQRSAAALSDRLERYWDSIRLEVFHTRELGLSLVQEVSAGGISSDTCIGNTSDQVRPVWVPDLAAAQINRAIRRIK